MTLSCWNLIYHNLDDYFDQSESTVASPSETVNNTNVNTSPALLRYSGGGTDFSLDEDLVRILGNEGQASRRESYKKQMSNTVRHGRSQSDKGSIISKDGKWPKSPVNCRFAKKLRHSCVEPSEDGIYRNRYWNEYHHNSTFGAIC